MGWRFFPLRPLCVSFVGPGNLLETMVGRLSLGCQEVLLFPAYGSEQLDELLARAEVFPAALTLVFDPPRYHPSLVARLPGLKVAVLTEPPEQEDRAAASLALCRLGLAFDLLLGGARIGGLRVWRSVLPPVADCFFRPPRPLQGAAKPLTVGCSTPHREQVLLDAKHRFDLLQVVAGASGAELVALMEACRIAVYAPREPGRGGGWQLGAHLAACQVLLCERSAVANGLEPGIDCVPFGGPGELCAELDKIARYPELYWSVIVRGRRKAEQFRASRLWPRLLFDLVHVAEWIR